MSEFVVHIEQNDVQIKIDHNILRIQPHGGDSKAIPIGMIGQIVIYSRTNISTSVLTELIKRGISVVIIGGFGREQTPAWLGPGLSTAVMTRLYQFQAFSDPQLKLKTVAFLVEKKISQQQSLMTFLWRLILNEPTDHIFNPSIRKADLIRKVENTSQIMNNCLDVIPSCESIESIRGYEGSASNAWFSFLADVLPKKWKFTGRNRQPPKDPINALLSLTYTLTFAECKMVINERGLDPCVGFLHTPLPGRESFAIDLIEPLRSGADAFVISLLDNHMFDENEFSTSKEHGCRLNRDARGKYYACWADWRTQWPIWQDDAMDQQDEDEEINEKHIRTCVRSLINQVVEIWPKCQ
jgi:CRISPR-associated protein Cas1